MNKFITLAALGLCFSSINAQEAKEEKKAEEGFVFTTIKENPITSIKNQNRSSTCWSFSSVAFLNQNCFVRVKANLTFLKCSSFTTLWKIVQ